MAMIALTSSCKSNLSRTLSSYESNNNNNRDASFSSHLNSSEENFVRKLADSAQNPIPVIASQEEQHYLGKRKEEEEEIGVFSAEKYFNGAKDDSLRLPKVSTRKYKYMKDEQIKVAPVKPKIQPGTPSVHSELSWNSQSTSSHSALRNPSRKQANKIQGKSFFAGLRCKCWFSDKDSVDMNEHIDEISFRKTANGSIVQEKTITKEPIKPTHLIHTIHFDKEDLGLNKENCSSFPPTNSTTGNLPMKVLSEEEEQEEKINPRKSLEVFGCPVLEKKDKSSGLERRLSMLSWYPRLEEIEISETPCDESYMSDASSDLFEIESLTGKANPFIARQGSDGCATPTAYAPSEDSIEWSVVTASAAEHEELRPTSPVRSFSATPNARTRTITEIAKRGLSISLGCKSHEAVFAGEAYRTNEKPNSDARISESCTPVTRFQAEDKQTGIYSRQRQHALAATCSPSSSHLLYIQ